ncbi:MAG: hydantoinase B/oxoprolinase family protein [Acidovorax sp.]|uniref:hydantoinase B/oxoprolinase family protein n=1 Tax=Acidovorax sp. TaxID=1872122 RepID=UPI00391AF320
MSRQIDPISVSVVWNSLLSVTDEMGSTIRRTAYSEAVREGDDFSTGLFDRRGRLIAQGNYSPGHLGAMPYLMEHVLRRFAAETFEPGDSIVVNDPYMGSGHLPDIFFVTPAFFGNTLVGFTVNVAHHVDVGGAGPGSQVVHGVTDAYQEGIRILPVKLVRRGEFEPDLLQMILGNVRIPIKVEGDLRAQRNANFVGVERFVRLYESMGEHVVEECIDEILLRSCARMKELMGVIPDGDYAFEDRIDDYGPDTGPVTFAVDLTVRDGAITVDYSRSSDQVAAGINSYINYTRAYAGFAVRSIAGALLPQNAGTIDAIKVVAREGCFFNPKHPAPSGGRAAIQVRMFEVVAGALAKALPLRTMAAFSHWSNPNIGGIDDSGRPFVMYDLVLGGYGARADTDGTEALSPVFNCSNIPVEVHEMNNPVLIRKVEFVADSGGAGKFRGGSAVRKEIELLCAEATVSLLGDRHIFQPFGLEGGKPGKLATTRVVSGEQERTVSSKEVITIKRGDVLCLQLNGAGGYGNPADRTRAAVESDIKDGFVSLEAARGDYGFM